MFCYTSIHPSIYPYICFNASILRQLSKFLSINLSVQLSIYQFIYIYIYIYSSIYLSIYLSIYSHLIDCNKEVMEYIKIFKHKYFSFILIFKLNSNHKRYYLIENVYNSRKKMLLKPVFRFNFACKKFVICNR